MSDIITSFLDAQRERDLKRKGSWDPDPQVVKLLRAKG
jgi:hypothetical protein